MQCHTIILDTTDTAYARQQPRYIGREKRKGKTRYDFFFWTFACFSPAPQVFPRALGCGARRGARAYTTAQVWAPAGLRGGVLWALKNRAKVAMEIPQLLIFALLLLYHVCIAVPHALFVAATVHQALLFVTTGDGASLRLCAMLPVGPRK